MIDTQSLETMILQNMGSRKLQRFAQPLTLVVGMNTKRFDMTGALPCPTDAEANRLIVWINND